MSGENVDVARKATDAWNSGGIEGVLEFSAEDAVWYPFPGTPGPAELHGHDGIREVMRGWSDSFDEYTITLAEVRDLGDKVVALGELSGLIRGSDAPVRQPIGSIVWDFRDGKIGKVRNFPSWEQTLEAARLPE
jgi:ketosteroid isomerase-like protein